MGNTSFSWGFTPSFSSWSSATPTIKTKQKDDYTYNPRYPGFDENDYKRLVEIVQAQGVTGSKFDQLMDDAYQYYYPQVLNKHKLAERGQELNNAVYENGNAILNWEGTANETIKLTQLAQKAKETYGVPYDYPDEDLLKLMEEGTDNRNKLLYDYVNNGSDEIFYETWIYEAKQGGLKSLINPASEWGILPEKKTEWLNPIWGATETIDNAANKFAESILVTGNKSAENLKNEIENMSQDEIDMWRNEFRKAVGEKRIGTAYTYGNNLVERLWNGIKGEKFYPEDDEAFMKWLIDKKANLGQSLIGADDILQGETSPNVIRFFGNIPGSAVKTFTATVRGMTNPVDTMKGLYKLAATEEWHQALLQRYGSWDALANAMNTDPVGVADDVLAVAELGANIVGGGMKFTGKVTWNTNLVDLGTNIKGSIGSANDALAQKTVGSLYWGMDNLAWKTDNKLVQYTNRYIQDTSSLNKLLQNGAEDLKAIENTEFWQSIKDAYNEAVNKIVGIDEEDREFIRENKDLVNENLSKKKNIETVYETVKEGLNDKALEKLETGEEYENLYKNKKKIVNTQGMTQDKDLMKTFKKNGISVDADGNLVFEKINEFDAKQQKALQDAWEVIKDMEGEKKLNSRQTLSQRRKIDNKVNWDWKPDKLTTADKDTEGLIRDMRKSIDKVAKRDIPWLKELDAKYQPLIEEVRQMNKDRFNSDGTLKDSARSKLRNLTRAWNEEKLSRLEKIIPWITKELKWLDVALTVEKASRQWVGQYSKGVLAWSIPAGIANPAMGAVWAVLWVLSSPKVYVRLIEAYPDIAQKISAGQELLPSDMNNLTSWASRIQDGMDEE